MDKQRIIEEIANQRIIEGIIQNVAGTQDEDLKDLNQDLYYDLLTKKDGVLLESLSATCQLNYYLTKMVINNIHSTSSPFYTQYKKRIKNKLPLDIISNDAKYTTDFDGIRPR